MEWWDGYAKPELRKYFIKLSKQETQEKYGTINLLQARLKKLQNNVLNSSVLHGQIKTIKERINYMKDEISESIKIRTRVEDRVHGEKISAHLLSKEKMKAKKRNMVKLVLGNGVELDNTDAILYHVKEHYKNLFSDIAVDCEMQKVFLNTLNCKLDRDDNSLLCNKITKKEVFQTLRSMGKGKTPGEDGLPVEFYLKVWDVIKDDFMEMV